MKTNFQMLRECWIKPENFGWLTAREIDAIVNHFEIKQRTDVELQNLRDFIVMYYSNRIDKTVDAEKRMEEADIMSGICGVIDQEKFNRGMEV